MTCGCEHVPTKKTRKTTKKTKKPTKKKTRKSVKATTTVYTANWCPHCQDIIASKQKLRKKGVNVVICGNDNCKNITSFPTVKGKLTRGNIMMML